MHRLAPTPFRNALRRAARAVLLLAAGSLTLLAWAPDPAAAVRVGSRYEDVVAALGKPEKTSTNLFGLFQNLYYPNYKIILKRGVVVEVKELQAPPQARDAAAPKPEAEAARHPEDKRPDPGPAEAAPAPPAQAPLRVPEVVVPGPVPPKAAQALPAPVDRQEPLAAPAPVPVSKPEASPVPPAPIVLAPAGLAVALPQDDLSAAVAQGVRRVGAVPAGHWTLRLVLARQPETVRNVPGFFKGARADVFVLFIPAPGGGLYHVFYGDFATREAAARKAKQLPAAFGHPAPFNFQQLRSLVAASR